MTKTFSFHCPFLQFTEIRNGERVQFLVSSLLWGVMLCFEAHHAAASCMAFLFWYSKHVVGNGAHNNFCKQYSPTGELDSKTVPH